MDGWGHGCVARMGLSLMSAGGDAAKGAAATLRGQRHCAVTSPSYCQPRLNVESQWFDQGTALSCGVSLRGSGLSKRWGQNR
jgi:hypothetical protein